MNWKEYISKLGLQDVSNSFEFNAPGTPLELKDLMNQFDLSELPAELEDLYIQTNGINQLLDGTLIDELVWPIERVIETNNYYRSDPELKGVYMPFDQLLFVSDAGNGDLFGFETINGKFNSYDIFVWDHEDDSRTWVAPNLKIFIEGWTNGTIEI